MLSFLFLLKSLIYVQCLKNVHIVIADRISVGGNALTSVHPFISLRLFYLELADN